MAYRCRNSRPEQLGLCRVIDQAKYTMMKHTDNQNQDARLESRVQVPAQPNESGRLDVQDHVRIWDPETQEILVEKRA